MLNVALAQSMVVNQLSFILFHQCEITTKLSETKRREPELGCSQLAGGSKCCEFTM